MPVSTNGIGYSNITPDKQQGLSAYLSMHMKITERILNKNKWAPQKYYYIDCTAGDGSGCQDLSEIGSPLIFLEHIKRHYFIYECHFIDNEKGNCDSLEKRINDGLFKNEKCHIICGDHNEIIPNIILEYPVNAYGMLYMDKNGIPNWNVLEMVSDRLPRFDILIRCPSSAIKRDRSRRESSRETLEESLSKIKKKIKLIREPLPNDKWQWIFIFLTNWTKVPEWKRQRFYRIDKQGGAEIYKKCVLTKKERMGYNDRIDN